MGRNSSAIRCDVTDRANVNSTVEWIVEEFGSTTVVFPHSRARVDDFDNLLLERSA